MPDYKIERKIAVSGGELHTALWGKSGPLLFCSHGITANHVSFLALARKLAGDYRLLAVDHRGRGQSRNITGPWGMQQHADDVIAVLDAYGFDQADLMIGHSMGAFISVVTKARYPQRIARLLLVDGGLPLMDEVPADLSTEDLIDAIIGPAMARLDQQFPSAEAYLDFWRPHPAFQGDNWSADVEHYFRYDLFGEAPALQPTARREAIIGDTESQLVSSAVPDALASLKDALPFVRAPRGMFDAEPLYSDARLKTMKLRYPTLQIMTSPEVNHYTVLIGPGADFLADYVRRHFCSNSPAISA